MPLEPLTIEQVHRLVSDFEHRTKQLTALVLASQHGQSAGDWPVPEGTSVAGAIQHARVEKERLYDEIVRRLRTAL